MASLGHIAVGMAAGRFWTDRGRPGRGDRSPFDSLARSMVAFSALSLAPDLDVIAFRFGIPYWAPFGHRGAAHSICVALVLGCMAALAPRNTREQIHRGQNRKVLWVLCASVAVSHGLLDMLTDGGLGIALLWPFSNKRYFAPWRPIPVAPIGGRMLSGRGLRVLLIEALQFAPVLLFAMWPRRKAAA
jgi:inner membrane protein